MDFYGITASIERAKALMASGEDHSLRYACLELRFCLETIAFRQLQQYGDTLPGDVIGKWQADQVIRRLASFDPQSDVEATLAFGVPKEDGSRPDEWIDFCKTKPISWRKFRKYHNKLGSFLHVPIPPKNTSDQIEKKVLTADSLNEIVSSIEAVADSTAILAVKLVIQAQCPCGNTLFVGDSEFENDEIVVCSNTMCNSLFLKHTNEASEQVLLPLKTVVFTCECKAKVPVELGKIWSPIRCPNCHITHRVNLAFARVTPVG
ncbi:hypothetical protein N7D90_10550 [Pseudomonas fragi]|uniref:hypothetical protein n=1 Tax=Pseudomonas fragi TaxID=296 RepID=UPI0021BFD29C|nr:hypothetical protein [Pseudomonas fragi]UXL40553.1 hypothetical protein N7D90_10550 [Pseudomonas fragi]